MENDIENTFTKEVETIAKLMSSDSKEQPI